MNIESQREGILRYLDRGKNISALVALSEFNCLRLSARIYELRKQGHNIETEMRTVHKGKRIAVYRLVQK